MKRFSSFREIDKLLPSRQAKLEKLKIKLKLEEKDNINKYMKADEKAKEIRTKTINKEKRRFLEMIGKSGISLPLIRSSSLLGGIMASRYASAAEYSNKRVIYVYLDSGAQVDSWLPDSAGSMKYVTEPFSGLASMCNFRAVDVLTEGHSNTTQALGVPEYGPKTMDARIAPILSASTPFSSVYVGTDVAQGSNQLLCSNIGPCATTPEDAISKYFTGEAPPPVMDGGVADMSHVRAFDANRKALDSIKNKLGQEERDRLGIHSDALAKLQSRIVGTSEDESGEQPMFMAGECATPGVNYQNNFQSKGKQQADVAIAALACGLTNVATVQIGNHQATWFGHSTSHGGDFHNALHGAGGDKSDEMLRYMTEISSHTLQKLTETTGPDGQKLSDTTVFVQVTCMGDGRNHSSNNAPFIVSSGLNGFNNGFSSSRGGTTKDLHGAIPRGLGIPDSMYETMGGDTLGLI